MLRQWLIWLLTAIESFCARLLAKLAPSEIRRSPYISRPPKHWVDLVKQRAPHLLETLPPEVVVDRFETVPPPPDPMGRRTALSRRPVIASVKDTRPTPPEMEAVTFTTTMRKAYGTEASGEEQAARSFLPNQFAPQTIDSMKEPEIWAQRHPVVDSQETHGEATPVETDTIRPGNEAPPLKWRSKGALPLTQSPPLQSFQEPASDEREQGRVARVFEEQPRLLWPRLAHFDRPASSPKEQFETATDHGHLVWPELDPLARQAPASRLSQINHRRKSDAEQRGTRWSE